MIPVYQDGIHASLTDVRGFFFIFSTEHSSWATAALTWTVEQESSQAVLVNEALIQLVASLNVTGSRELEAVLNLASSFCLGEHPGT